MTDSQDPNRNRNRIRLLISGLLLGFLVWVLSPWLVGQGEPWDADWPFYAIVMVLGGGILGAIWPRHFLLAYGSIWLGQCAALLLPPQDWTWLPLGVVTTAIGASLALFGFGVGALTSRVLRALRRGN